MNDNLKTEISSSAAGFTAGAAAYAASSYTALKVLNKGVKAIQPTVIPQEIHNRLNKGCKDMFIKEGFKAEGIEVADISTKAGKNIIDEQNYKKLHAIKERMAKAGYFERAYLARRLKYTLLGMQRSNKEVRCGKNASFNWGIGNKKVYINTKNGMHMFPHELGHAMNHRILGEDGQRIVYGVLRNRKVSRYMIRTALLASLLINNKKERKNNDSDNIIIRGVNFIKDNSAKLAFLALTPLVIEEGMASVHGQRMAKKYFNKDVMKYITKSHLHSFTSYLKLPVTACIAMYSAKKARDYVCQKLKDN